MRYALKEWLARWKLRRAQHADDRFHKREIDQYAPEVRSKLMEARRLEVEARREELRIVRADRTARRAKRWGVEIPDPADSPYDDWHVAQYTRVGEHGLTTRGFLSDEGVRRVAKETRAVRREALEHWAKVWGPFIGLGGAVLAALLVVWLTR